MRRNIIVVKYGGAALKDRGIRSRVLSRIARLSRRKPVVLVHGGGPEITAVFRKMGRRPRFIRGRRYTDRTAIAVVERVLSAEVNKALVADLWRKGAKPVGVSGRDGGLLPARKIPGLGFVGSPLPPRVRMLQVLLREGFLPVVSSIGCDSRGNPLNINADEAAAAIGVGLQAGRLIFLTDVPGVYDEKGRIFRRLSARQARDQIRRGAVTGGMIPKVEAALACLARGVKEVRIGSAADGLSEKKGTVFYR